MKGSVTLTSFYTLNKMRMFPSHILETINILILHWLL